MEFVGRLCYSVHTSRMHIKSACGKNILQKLKELKGKSKQQQRVAEEKPAPTGGLNALLKKISPGVAVRKKTTRLPAQKPICSLEETAESPLISRQCGKLLYTEDEFLHFCVHNTNLYMMLATFHAMKDEKKDPVHELNSLSKNKLSIEHCNYIMRILYANFTGFIDLQVITLTHLKNAFYALQIPTVHVIYCQDHFTLFVAGPE